MHEYSIVRALLDRIEQAASAHGAESVVRVHLAIGELAGIETPLLLSAFELVRTGTCCAEAELEVRSVASRWVCRSCAAEIPAGQLLRCPACGTPARLAAGDEIVLERLEMEVA